MNLTTLVNLLFTHIIGVLNKGLRTKCVLEDKLLQLLKKRQYVTKHFMKYTSQCKSIEIHLKYSGYIEKEKSNADKLNRLEN